ncbi:putative quinol monooxygenase [Methylocella sp. CPCC 101449]|uniref:putative quinol monooxygenase n=1 Tax=Methylocella sp. CPCC 101449 TaxID=2987531 RepID=UPI00095FCC32|nr:putative quinol monooxygenase [Methylocella sp. CPCC 101449]MBN9080938.1 antibiotic biosynthesis monooxygenase [Hyphomicrobiales bacterium]MDT2020096.1 antibiotic biosynthesis monooxygenase [Methylocella sp. CPCC 101449]OJY00255.1 MAG: antibiotic biosynthesis monooxygenase [Rhizobiales bacterium 62-17]HEV2574965.1 putative quinol monooxygenase [Beijerinckiaceae bacterium]
MIYVISTAHLKPGTQAQAVAAAKPCLAETLKEDGCLSYDLHVSVSDPDKVVFVERWESRDHLAAHTRTPHFLAWRAAAADFVANRTVEVIDPAQVTGL